MKPTLAILFFVCLFGNHGFAQVPKGNSFPDASGGTNHLVLTADVAKASRTADGHVIIPFVLKNESNREITLGFGAWSGRINALAVMEAPGKITYIENIGRKTPLLWAKSAAVASYTLKPGESISDMYSEYHTETLWTVKGRKVFGVLSGYIANDKKEFVTYSAPFVVPSELATPPWTDLGRQTYLSIAPDLTKIYFHGGNFLNAALQLQRADPNYADSIKHGWAESFSLPFSVRNMSDQNIIVSVDRIDYHIVGKKTEIKSEREMKWYLVKLSMPILKSGEANSDPVWSEWNLSVLETNGYKSGDKIVAVVGGRIAGTNKIFECYSAPFELPPLPRGHP